MMLDLRIIQTIDARHIDEVIVRYAREFGLRREIISGIVDVESRRDPWAFRFEPGFFNRHLRGKKRDQLVGYVPDGVPTFDSELVARASSWGLMQIMGDRGRTEGFTGPYLSQLLVPDINVQIGCSFLRRLYERATAPSDAEKYRSALLRYNGGADRSYPERVFAAARARV